MNLNLPPDRRGQIPAHDAAILHEWGRVLRETFAHNLASRAVVSASNTRGEDVRFAGSHVVDNHAESYWATDDDVLQPSLVLNLPAVATFDVIRLREHLPLGQRVTSFSIEAWQENVWHEIAHGTSIGSQRLLWLSDPVVASKVRLRITGADACPAISEFALFSLAPINRQP